MEGQLVAIEMQRFTHQQPMWAYGFGLYVTATYDMLVTTNGLTVFVGLRGGADFFAEGVWFWFMPGGTFLIGHRF